LALSTISFVAVTFYAVGDVVKDSTEFRSDAAKKAVRRYRSSVEEAQKAFEKSREEIHERYIKDLRGALKEAFAKEDLAEANAINAEIKAARDGEGLTSAGAGKKAKSKGRRPAAGAKRFRGNAYLLVDQKVTWHTARDLCEQMGGHLATITSSDEHRFVNALTGGKSVWLGATDEDVEGKWRWVTGERFGFQGWASKPDNHQDCQHYLFFWNGRGWDDNFAGKRQRFVCEWED